MEKLYCTIFLVDVSQNPEEVETVSSRIVQLIEDHGGVIKLNNPWGKRRLAYPLEGRTSAFYFEIEFTASSHLNIPNIIEKEYRLNDRVLRYLTYVVTKDELEQRRLNERRGRSSASGDDRRPSDRGSKVAPAPAAAEKVEKAKEAASTEAKTAPVDEVVEEKVEKAKEAASTEAKTAPVDEVVEEKVEKAADTVVEEAAEKAPETAEKAPEAAEKVEEVVEAAEETASDSEPKSEEATKTEKD